MAQRFSEDSVIYKREFPEKYLQGDCVETDQEEFYSLDSSFEDSYHTEFSRIIGEFHNIVDLKLYLHYHR